MKTKLKELMSRLFTASAASIIVPAAPRCAGAGKRGRGARRAPYGSAAGTVLAVALCAVGFAAFAAPDAVQLWEGGPCWATCNVGADTPEGYGILTNFNDAAQAVTNALGGDWRLPSDGELEMLAGKNEGDPVCSNVWTTCNGVAGRRFFGMTSGYEGKSIFLPAAGSDFGSGRIIAGTRASTGPLRRTTTTTRGTSTSQRTVPT